MHNPKIIINVHNNILIGCFVRYDACTYPIMRYFDDVAKLYNDMNVLYMASANMSNFKNL